MDSRRSVISLAVVVMLMAAGVGTVCYFAGEKTTPHHIVGCLASAAPFFTGGLVALLGARRGRPWFVAAAGLGLVPISLVSVVLWPVLVPAGLLVAKGAGAGASTRTAPDVPVSVAIVAGMLGTFALLLFHQDPATWETSLGGASSSNIITITEALVTGTVLLSVVGLVLLASTSATPATRRQAQP